MLTSDGRPITLDDAMGIPDILDQTRYLLMFGQIPGSGDTKDLSIKATSVVIPGTSNEAFEATMGGHTLNFRGRRKYPPQFSVTFYEDSQVGTLKKLRKWLELCAGAQSGNSQGYINDYSVPVGLTLFDTTGKAVAQHTLYRVYPEEISDAQLSAESSTAVQVTAQFRMTWFESDTHSTL